MNEKPILFSSEMVRAILEGRKTLTRRVVKEQKTHPHLFKNLAAEPRFVELYEHGVLGLCASFVRGDMRDCLGKELTVSLKCPYEKVGSKLWVRETFLDGEDYPCSPHYEDETISRWLYRADLPLADTAQVIWKPSIFMPRCASRISLEITDIQVEKLRDLSFEDARQEGVICPLEGLDCSDNCEARNDEFRRLWDGLNGKRGFGWHSNPFVWAITFKRI
jgi:hypothetical protein